jgi:hypothetical protein
MVPEVQKNLTPAAIKRSEPPFFDPEREGKAEGQRKKRRRRRHPRPDAGEPGAGTPSDEPGRGSRVNIRA